MKKIVFIFALSVLLCCKISFAYPEISNIRVGIIDSGVNGENAVLGYNFLDNNEDTKDNKGHGTKIANIILDIAPSAQIVPLKCTEKDMITDNSAIIKAIYSSANDFKCDVINISIGMPDSKELKDAIDYVINKGVIVISAVGNDGEISYKKEKIYYPAGYDDVIGVGSVDKDNKVASYSQKNKSVFVVTPTEHDGTSFSAAKVTAIAAIAKSFNKKISASFFKKYLIKSSMDFGTQGFDYEYGNGILDFDLIIKNLEDDYPVYVTYMNESSLKLYNNSENEKNVIIVLINDNVITKELLLKPKEEKIFSIYNNQKCFIWRTNIFDIVCINEGEI